ncbi:MAG: thioesterase [Gammaproteobacteria bacterium]|nr:MAG: thioesterase [Gammaproteobacteria bacterium]
MKRIKLPDLATFISPFLSAELSPPATAQWRAKRRVAKALRRLINAMMSSTPDAKVLDAIAADLDKGTQALKKSPRHYGIRDFVVEGSHGNAGEINHEVNAVGGWSNPLSPGLHMWIEGNKAYGEVSFSWAYEGPPACVHGGYIAAVLDQFLGMAHMAMGQPGVTGMLEIHYHRPVPLNTKIKLSADIAPAKGRKTRVKGEMRVGGKLMATGEGLFIRPRRIAKKY